MKITARIQECGVGPISSSYRLLNHTLSAQQGSECPPNLRKGKLRQDEGPKLEFKPKTPRP
jgi:hypothetical protein